ncbi:hypothetical protein KR222_010275, partial [Zaprionus bogoriensis]
IRMLVGTRERARSPVFGRIVNREPTIPHRASFELRHSNPGNPKFYASEVRPISVAPLLASSSPIPSPRRSSKNRYMGSPSSSVGQNSVAVQGSFQKLKELIWTERAKELIEQRRSEELAARAAVLKDIANGQNIQASYKPPFRNVGDFVLMDENRSPDPAVNLYVNDERISIANGQLIDKNNKNNGNTNSGHRKNGGRASMRHIGGSYGPFSTTVSSGTGRKEKFLSTKLDRLTIPASELITSEISESSDLADMGIPRKYPIRQSHFRERNRSLSKEV